MTRNRTVEKIALGPVVYAAKVVKSDGCGMGDFPANCRQNISGNTIFTGF